MTPPDVHPFLLGALRGSGPPSLVPLVRDARDWERVLRDAAAQGLTPFLHRWLKNADLLHSLPEAWRARLERQAFGLAARGMLLASELRTALERFEGRGVFCAPLRGFALAERLYGHITARPMGDLDLLVQKEDLADVAAIFAGLGFREMDRRPGFARVFSHTLEFYKDRHGWVMIEPHWTISYPPYLDRVDMKEVWRRCVRGQVVGVETWLLGPEDLLLHLCLHITHRDGTAPLLWFYELDRLLRQEGESLDWPRFLSLSHEAGLECLVWQSLGTARALFASPLPEPIRDALARDPGRSGGARLARLVGRASGVDGKESLAAFFTLKGFRAKLHYALALLFPSPEFMRLEYGLTHRRQFGLAYFRRFCHLSWESVKGVRKLLF